MKTALLGILGLCFSLSAISASADTSWHSVLNCDNGAAVVDNINAFGRGGEGVAAQIVIRDPQIVIYFLRNHAAGEIVDGQWIGKSYFEPAVVSGVRKDALVSFSGQGVVVNSYDHTLTVTTGGANWTFRNCNRN